MLFVHSTEARTVARCDEGDLELAYGTAPNGEHPTYWVPVCGCGWRGEPRYFRGYAMNDLRDHHAMVGPEVGSAADRGDQPPTDQAGEQVGARTAA